MNRLAAASACAVAAVFAATSPASAEEPAVCYGVVPLNSPEFAEPSLKVVSPDAPKKLVFAKNGYQEKGCPDAAELCSTDSHVVPGDRVIVGARNGAYSCATYVGRKPASAITQGWLAAAALSDPKTAPPPELSDWAGKWRSGGEKRITVKRAGDQLNIVGEATWGAGDPRRLANGGVHEGGFEATATPSGTSVGFSTGPNGETQSLEAKDGFCKVRLWRLGPYLVASDDNGCGGANVTFSGVYRRD